VPLLIFLGLAHVEQMELFGIVFQQKTAYLLGAELRYGTEKIKQSHGIYSRRRP